MECVDNNASPPFALPPPVGEPAVPVGVLEPQPTRELHGAHQAPHHRLEGQYTTSLYIHVNPLMLTHQHCFGASCPIWSV